MAVDASSVSVVLGAPGQAGSPQVVTAAGLVFTTAPAPAATSAYWNYDGTNLVGNVPTSKGFQFTVNGSEVANFSSTGLTITFPRGTLDSQIGSSSWGINAAGGRSAQVYGTAANGASAVAAYIASGPNYTTAGAKIFSAGTNGAAAYAEQLALFAVASANPITHVGQLNSAHVGGGSVPLSLNTCRIGLGAGTTSSGTAVTASGHDLAGRIGVTVNSTGTVSQPVLLVSFATAYNTPPFIQLTPGNAATATQSLATTPFPVTTTTGFSIQANTTGMPAGTYVWYYKAIQ